MTAKKSATMIEATNLAHKYQLLSENTYLIARMKYKGNSPNHARIYQRMAASYHKRMKEFLRIVQRDPWETVSNAIKIDSNMPDGMVRLAVLDAVPYYNDGEMITRINVPKSIRGKGYGTKLLKNACDRADERNIKLWLEISPYPDSPLQVEELREWYRRYGFTGAIGAPLRRLPR